MMYAMYYQSYTDDSDVCTNMSDCLDINYRIIPHSLSRYFPQFCANEIFWQRNKLAKYLLMMMQSLADNIKNLAYI